MAGVAREPGVVDLLGEALPTALGQGLADRTFRPKQWSRKYTWYHIESVDRFAKAIFPVVEEALETGRPFDERFLRKVQEVYLREPTRR